MAPRPTWKGLLKVSLVTIPIKVFPATDASESLSFNQLHAECQSRMQQKRWCPTCEREVPSAEIVKGFEFETGKYVVLLPEELDAVQPESTKVIDLVQFAEASELHRVYIDRSYFLVPDGPDDGAASHAYGLVYEAIDDRCGIGKLAIYGREYLVAVGRFRGTLMLYTLHHAAELREAPSLAVMSTMQVGTAEATLMRRVVAALKRSLYFADFTDQYHADLRRLIDAKIAGQEIVVPAVVDQAPVLSLQDALAQSLAAVSATKKTPAKARPAATRKRA